jgi:transcriptional regulator NrdR family protein
MDCTNCGSKTTVDATHTYTDLGLVYRRRVCTNLKCNKRFPTWETLELPPYITPEPSHGKSYRIDK